MLSLIHIYSNSRSKKRLCPATTKKCAELPLVCEQSSKQSGASIRRSNGEKG